LLPALNSFLDQHRSVLPCLEVDQVNALASHLALLERWNRTINLTAIRKQDEASQKHIGESLFLAAHLPPGTLRICDLGSGGGFPGIPVAIARPDCKITLVESDIRKGVFLREASRNLPNVSVLSQRFESVQGQFDWLISRAVNLSKTIGGPQGEKMAFLGGVDIGRGSKQSLSAQFKWHSIPIPWDSSGFLHLGERFT
jgi:16S rRNA (guanine527-N7)-methyltransferase